MNKQSIRKEGLRLLPPILISLFLITVGGAGAFRAVDSFLSDLQLRMTPSPKESEILLLIDVDDATVDPNSGISAWPIPREYYADALLTLAELQAREAVFDIEFLGRSQLEFSPEDFEYQLLNPVLTHLQAMDSAVSSYLPKVASDCRAGGTLAPLQRALSEVSSANRNEMDSVYSLLQNFAFDRDQRLANGAACFGNAFFAASLRRLEGEAASLSQKEARRRSDDFYAALSERILSLVDSDPDSVRGDLAKFVCLPHFTRLLTALEPALADWDADTDIASEVAATARAHRIVLSGAEEALLQHPSVLALSYDLADRLAALSLKGVTERGACVADYPVLEFPTDRLLSGARGIGFSNVRIDSDGKRRRVALLAKTGDFYWPQLGFSALLQAWGNPTIEVFPRKIVLTGQGTPELAASASASVQESEAAPLPGASAPSSAPPKGWKRVIPLDPDGCMLIQWPHKNYVGRRNADGTPVKGRAGEDSFAHLSFLKCHLTTALIPHLRSFFSQVQTDPAFADAAAVADCPALISLLDTLEASRLRLLSGEAASPQDADALLTDYRRLKTELDEALGALVHPPRLARLQGQLRAARGNGNGAETASLNDSIRAEQATADFFADYLGAYLEARESCKRLIRDKLCIIGFSASSTTDFGVTPFQKDYPNMGTHAAVINTLLQGRFLREIPLWVAVWVTLIATFALYFALRPLSPILQVVCGFASIVVLLSANELLFFLTGAFFPVFMPALSMTLTFVTETAIRLVTTSREKNYVRKAFSHYLSNDVINEIMKDPDKLKLGGEARYMTAVFTDVKGFSTISEQLTAPQLVTLLNAYLSEMSNIILELRGLIDKYEGDAIIAFFGAPNELSEHAYNTCLAAVRMHRKEEELNRRFLAEKMTPSPLLTRIGINTGEMVVGNMGTATKMNYTMMGSAVNLAARLEGVNKQYGTWILMSEATFLSGGNRFFTRRIDRVRVVGIREPVWLYELIEENDRVTEEMRQGVECFHGALALYEKREWKAAGAAFQKVLQWLPDDGPSLTYLERCARFETAPPPSDWDGVNNLTAK